MFMRTGLTPAQFASKVIAHGATGGVMSAIQGGSFGHGFVSAAVTQAAAGKIDNIGGNGGARVAAAALVGGSVSVLTGGKFANGAVTAAFSRAFNEEAHGGWADDLVEYGPGFASDAVVGFGDGVYKAVTLGIGDLGAVRGVAGVSDFNGDQRVYEGSFTIGGIHGGFALGGSLGSLGRGRAGWEYSHWVPDKILRRFGLSKAFGQTVVNGTRVPGWFHAMTDKAAYRFLPRTWKAVVPSIPGPYAQVLRTPPAIAGAGLGATVDP